MVNKLLVAWVITSGLTVSLCAPPAAAFGDRDNQALFDRTQSIVMQGQNTFRFDTFGNEDFWTGSLRLNEAIEGEDLGGVGPGLSPRAALDLGLKVDLGALPVSLAQALQEGGENLDDPAVTLQLIRFQAVVGVKGNVVGENLQSVGITCALCHATVDNPSGIGRRLDGFANRDLDVGTIISLAPDLSAIASLLGVSEDVVREVLQSWGPGKFDAELILDGKAYNPQQITDGVVTGTNVPGATLLPNAFALAGHNEHAWEGGWGTVTYWNALVANLEMHGKGNFFDPRLDDADKYPIAAAHGFGHVVTDPDQDLITPKLPALHLYQLVLPAPEPTPGVDFDAAAAERGGELFRGRAQCVDCHKPPLWTEPGWNLHTPEEIGIDGFQAGRGPDDRYRTMNLAGIFVRENGLFMKPENKGRYYHDGRFATLLDVVDHYDVHFTLGLSEQEKSDVVEYLKSLGDPMHEGPVPARPDPVTRNEVRRSAEPATLVVDALGPGSSLRTVSYRLAEGARISLKIFDVGGRVVADLADGWRDRGEYTATWDPRKAPSGVYFCRLNTGGREISAKLVVTK